VTLSWGAGLILLASVSASAYNSIQKTMLDRCRPLEITTWAIWAGTLLLGVSSPLNDCAGGILARGGVALVNTLGRTKKQKKAPGPARGRASD